MGVMATADRSRNHGGHWLLAVLTASASGLLLWADLRETNAWRICVDAHDPSTATPTPTPTPTPTQGPCATSWTWMALAMLAFWTLALATSTTGLVIGIVEGRHRRRFADGRWTSAGVVALCAPWAMLACGLGYGLGCLLPMSRLSPASKAHRDGAWQQAIDLYQALAAGQQPPTVYAPDLPAAGIVYMDVPFRFARWFGANVTHQPGGMVAVGPPSFVAGTAVGRLIGTSIGYARAASLSRRQWRGHDLARVVVDATATWCQVRGRWLRYDHAAVVAYQVADQSSVLTFEAIDPLRLHGPSAWCHAVLFAYLRYGPAWQTVPFLQPLRQAAQQASRPVGC